MQTLQLEEALGGTLFHRTARHVEPALASRPLVPMRAAFELVMLSHRQVDSPAVRRFIDDVAGASGRAGPAP